LYNRGEDLVEVLSFDLREALCYETGSLSTIGLNVKYPTVFNYPAASRVHHHVKDMSFGEGLYFPLAGSSPFL